MASIYLVLFTAVILPYMQRVYSIISMTNYYPFQAVCQSIAVVLHYSFLVTFMWMLMEGVVLYVALVKVFVTKPRRYIISFTVISYGQSNH